MTNLESGIGRCGGCGGSTCSCVSSTSVGPCGTLFLPAPSATPSLNRVIINAAIQTAIANGGGVVCFQPGIYLVDDSVIMDGASYVTLRGAGQGLTSIVCNKAAAHVIQMGILNGIVQATFNKIEKMSVGHWTAQTAGYAAIYMNNCYACTAENVTSYGTHTARFWYVECTGLNGGSYINYLKDFVINNCSEAAIWLGNAASAGLPGVVGGPYNVHGTVQGIYIENGDGGSNYRDLVICNASGVEIDNVDFIQATNVGLYVAPVEAVPGLPQYVQAVFAVNYMEDTAAGAGYFFGGTGYIRHCEFNGCWSASSTTNNGVTISNANFIENTFDGCHVINNDHHGIQVTNAGKGNSINDCKILGNSQELTNTYDGINIAAGLSGWTITDSKSGPRTAAAALHRYGIYIAAGAGDELIITGNNLLGNATDGLYDGSTGLASRIDNNLGVPVSGSNVQTANDVHVVNGDNQLISIKKRGPIIHGVVVDNAGAPAAPFNINSIQTNGVEYDGQLLLLTNKTAQDMVIVNEAVAEADTTKRIVTRDGLSHTCPANAAALFMYEANAAIVRWVLVSP